MKGNFSITSIMFVHLLVVLFFAAVGAIPSGRVDVVYPSIETSRSGIKTMKFRALDQDIELRLEPAGDVIADDFSVVDGNHRKIDNSVDIQSLKRKLYRDAKNGAALHIDEDGPLAIKGIINSELRIEPHTTEETNDGRIAHRVIEVLKDKNLRQVVRTIPPGAIRALNHTPGMQKDECIKIEYLFVAESSFADGFNNTKELEVYIFNLMNAAKNLLDTLGFTIRVIVIGLLQLMRATEAQTAPYISPPPKGLDAVETLKSFAKFYCKSTDVLFLRADIVMLITKRPVGDYDEKGMFDPNTDGISFQNNICQQCYKYGIVTDNTQLNERADTVAHESAHLLGCDHDGEGDDITGSEDCPANDGYIMGNRNKKNGMKFSPCCKRSVRNQLQKAESRCIVEACKDV